MTKDSCLVNLYSFSIGLILSTTHGLAFAATQDLLVDTLIPSSTILTANITPQFTVQLIFAYCLPQGYLPLKVAIIIVSHVAGFGLVIFTDNVYVNVCGVTISAIGIGLGYPTFYAFISQYGQQGMIMHAGGSGLGIFIPQLIYTGLTTWFSVSTRISIGVMSCGLPLVGVIYFLLNKIPPSISDSVSHHGKDYQPLPSEDDDNNGIDSTKLMTVREKMRVTGQISVVSITGFIVFFVYYSCMKSIATTLAYPNSPFSPRDSYQYNSIWFSFGNFIGRLYLSVFKCLSSTLYSGTVVHRVCFLGVMSVGLDLIFLFESWYRFIHNAWVIMCFSFLVGLNVGVAFANAFIFLSESVKPRYLPFALSVFCVVSTLGTTVAAFLGFYIEPQLYLRCAEISPSEEYCLTRDIVKLEIAMSKEVLAP